MIAYVDTSALLRVALGQPDALAEWDQLTQVVSSALLRAEALRALDWLRLKGKYTDEALARSRMTVLDLLRPIRWSKVTPKLLARGEEPFPTWVSTLDAIHLASALAWRKRIPDLVVATHDNDLATCAVAHGFKVIGSSSPGR